MIRNKLLPVELRGKARPSIKYTPRFPGHIYGFAVNTIKRYYPALCSDYDFDDLMQEAYIVFIKVKRGFRDTPDNPINESWFMAMYKRSLHNKLLNLKEKAGRLESLDVTSDSDERLIGPETDFDLRQVLQDLSDDVKTLIHIFLSDDEKASRRAYFQLRKMYPDVK